MSTCLETRNYLNVRVAIMQLVYGCVASIVWRLFDTLRLLEVLLCVQCGVGLMLNVVGDSCMKVKPV